MFAKPEICHKFVANVRIMKKDKELKVKPYPITEPVNYTVEETVSPDYKRGGLAHAIALLGLAQPDSMLDAPSDFDLVHLIRQGLSKMAMDRIMLHYDITALDMARILHTSDRTMRRYTDESLLNPEQSERLIELAKLYAHGIDVFGSSARFRRWLNSTILSLGNQRPLDLLDTSVGISLVDDTLGRIEHGIAA